MLRLLAIIMLFSSVALGHGGRTDSLGCHNDRQRGGYHCHSGPLDGRSFSSKEEARRAFEGNTSESSSKPETPQPVPVAPIPAPAVPYDRDLYGSWIDADGDCQDTRQEVLIAESITPVQLDSRGCRVVSGTWLDPFTGQTFTNPGDLDIDHFIPLAEAHRSGADRWPSQLRRQFANDLSWPGSLIAVSASANRSKGARDPAGWLPPNEEFHCDYVRNWVITKAYWGLAMDGREREAVYNVLADCEQPVRGLSH